MEEGGVGMKGREKIGIKFIFSIDFQPWRFKELGIEGGTCARGFRNKKNKGGEISQTFRQRAVTFWER